jgi:hypothetical protein
MRKQDSCIQCILQDCPDSRWRVRFVVNGESSFSLLLDSWAQAVAAADDKHAELEQSGWTPALDPTQ